MSSSQLSFIMSFGVVKALANLFVGRLGDRIGVIAGVTFLSGVVAQGVMRETLPSKQVAQIPAR